MIKKEFNFITHKATLKSLSAKKANELDVWEINIEINPEDITCLHITENNNCVEIPYNNKNNQYN